MPAKSTVPVIERALARVEVRGPDECWTWLGALHYKGYGELYVRPMQKVKAHRYIYEHYRGPIPDGMHLDHLCRNRSCVNPAHLEPVSNRENFLRGEHVCAVTHRTDRCKRGHAFTENAYVNPKTGVRYCKACRRVREGRIQGTAAA